MRTLKVIDDEMSIKAFKAEYGAMKKAALRFAEEYFSDDDSIKSIKLKNPFWTYCPEEERHWEQGKPSNEDLIEFGDVEVGFEIVIKRKPNAFRDYEDSDFNIYSYFDGATFKDQFGEFDLEIR
jgi:hypothetical protein